MLLRFSDLYYYWIKTRENAPLCNSGGAANNILKNSSNCQGIAAAEEGHHVSSSSSCGKIVASSNLSGVSGVGSRLSSSSSSGTGLNSATSSSSKHLVRRTSNQTNGNKRSDRNQQKSGGKLLILKLQQVNTKCDGKYYVSVTCF